MSTEEIITSLRAELQNIEDMKTELAEAQERIREAICELEILKEAGK
jgi:hypothetical protein